MTFSRCGSYRKGTCYYDEVYSKQYESLYSMLLYSMSHIHLKVE